MFQIRYFLFYLLMMLIEGNNLFLIITSPNSKIDQINTWLKSNKLFLNATTHYMIFYRSLLEGKSAIINYLLITRC